MSTTNFQAEPSQAPPLTVAYGLPRTKDLLFFLTKLPIPRLHAIIVTAPQAMRKDLHSTATKDDLVVEVLRIHDLELTVTLWGHTDHAKQLDTLLNTSPADIPKMSKEEPHSLKTLMQSALMADPTLLPAAVPENPSEAAAVAITWQFSAFRKSIHPSSLQMLAGQQQQSQPPANQTLPQLLASASPAPVRQNDQSENTSDEDDEPPRKKFKHLIKPKEFYVGLLSAQTQGLANYPEKEVSSIGLTVDALMGPSILLSLIAAGTDVPTFLSQFFCQWRRMPSRQPSAAEIDAQTLGRMILIEMLLHRSSKDALEQRPSI